jgi:hypothetical protein
MLSLLRLWLCFVMVGSEEVSSHKSFVYHGKIWRNAQPGDVVEIDQPIYVRNRNGLTSGMYCLLLSHFMIFQKFSKLARVTVHAVLNKYLDAITWSTV